MILQQKYFLAPGLFVSVEKKLLQGASTCREIGKVAPVSNKLVKIALRRRVTFASKEAAIQSYGSRAWKNFDPAMLRSYVTHGFRDLPGVPLPLPLPLLQV
jgi:hypothetical protein